MKLSRLSSKISLLLLSQILIQYAGAQTAEILSQYKSQYSGQHIVQKLHQETVKIEMVKSVPVVTSYYSDQHLILTGNGINMLAEDDIEFSSFEKIANIDAYSLAPKEKGSKKIEATNFKTKDAETSGGVFHDGSKETSFMFPALAEGSLRVLNYECEMGEYRFPMGFSFANYIPIEKSVFQIEHDTSVHLIFKTYNFEGNNIQFEEKIVKGKKILTWTCLDPKPLKFESNAPNSRYYAPLVYAQIAYYNTKAGLVNAVGTLNDLHEWYKDNVKEVLQEEPSEEIKTLTSELVAGKTDELEKVKAIYYWVQDNIKYIAFEEGLGGFVPRLPSQVCSKRFGDCKDMATLIYTMLKSAGIKANLTWIGSRDLPFRYTDFPSTISDNHMIATYRNGDKIYFLDATSSFQPIDYPTGFILGKEAFVHIDDQKGEVIEVPILPASMTQMIDTARITFENKKIKGSSTTRVTGYYNILLHDILKNSPADKMNKTMESIVQKGSNNFTVTKSSIENLNDRERPLIMQYDFEFDNYVTSYEKETYVNMILEKDITAESEIKDGRRSPVELDHFSKDQYTVILDVPKSMRVKSLPKNAVYKSGFVNYAVNYKQIDNRVYMTLDLELTYLLLQPADFAEWNNFIKIMKKSMAETVVLEKLN